MRALADARPQRKRRLQPAAEAAKGEGVDVRAAVRGGHTVEPDLRHTHHLPDQGSRGRAAAPDAERPRVPGHRDTPFLSEGDLLTAWIPALIINAEKLEWVGRNVSNGKR
jgi:hypothetical protein